MLPDIVNGAAGLFPYDRKALVERGVIDSGFVAALQLGQHYELASYGTLSTYAQALGMDEAAERLQQTLEEERTEDERLMALALSVTNPRAQE